jgi:hypothetical protein
MGIIIKALIPTFDISLCNEKFCGLLKGRKTYESVQPQIGNVNLFGIDKQNLGNCEIFSFRTRHVFI